MKELQPINQQVLLDLSESKMKQTASGIIIPDTVEEKPIFAKVLSLSNIENPEINVGETVLFKKYSGTEIEFEGRKYLLMPYADILAKIVETEEI
jgi:chaperonin GroES